ncbi:MAG: hypothetical protein INQ03_24015 [Candidatus Heimdallarchaeota archaeon]|nr:hypothetical protein [Candidatus Heimdallarchaeota archaeon]
MLRSTYTRVEEYEFDASRLRFNATYRKIIIGVFIVFFAFLDGIDIFLSIFPFILLFIYLLLVPFVIAESYFMKKHGIDNFNIIQYKGVQAIIKKEGSYSFTEDEEFKREPIPEHIRKWKLKKKFSDLMQEKLQSNNRQNQSSYQNRKPLLKNKLDSLIDELPEYRKRATIFSQSTCIICRTTLGSKPYVFPCCKHSIHPRHLRDLEDRHHCPVCKTVWISPTRRFR